MHLSIICSILDKYILCIATEDFQQHSELEIVEKKGSEIAFLPRLIVDNLLWIIEISRNSFVTRNNYASHSCPICCKGSMLIEDKKQSCYLITGKKCSIYSKSFRFVIITSTRRFRKYKTITGLCHLLALEISLNFEFWIFKITIQCLNLLSHWKMRSIALYKTLRHFMSCTKRQNFFLKKINY